MIRVLLALALCAALSGCAALPVISCAATNCAALN